MRGDDMNRTQHAQAQLDMAEDELARVAKLIEAGDPATDSRALIDAQHAVEVAHLRLKGAREQDAQHAVEDQRAKAAEVERRWLGPISDAAIELLAAIEDAAAAVARIIRAAEAYLSAVGAAAQELRGIKHTPDGIALIIDRDGSTSVELGGRVWPLAHDLPEQAMVEPLARTRSLRTTASRFGQQLKSVWPMSGERERQPGQVTYPTDRLRRAVDIERAA
jgi:hypothetical protein